MTNGLTGLGARDACASKKHRAKCFFLEYEVVEIGTYPLLKLPQHRLRFNFTCMSIGK